MTSEVDRGVDVSFLPNVSASMPRSRPRSAGKQTPKVAVSSRLRRALYRLRAPWAFLQALLAAAVITFLACWLAIPDVNRAEVTLSFALAFAGLASFFWLESALFALLRRRAGRVAIWKGAILLAGLSLFYMPFIIFLDAGALQDASRAAAWSTHQRLRQRVSPDTLLAVQHVGWWLLRWTVAAAIVPFAIEGAATGLRGRWAERALMLCRQPLYWCCLLVGAGAATCLTQELLLLRPQLSTVSEILLTVCKVVVLFTVNVGVGCFVLSLAATYLRDAERARPEAPAARPNSSRHRRR